MPITQIFHSLQRLSDELKSRIVAHAYEDCLANSPQTRNVLEKIEVQRDASSNKREAKLAVFSYREGNRPCDSVWSIYLANQSVRAELDRLFFESVEWILSILRSTRCSPRSAGLRIMQFLFLHRDSPAHIPDPPNPTARATVPTRMWSARALGFKTLADAVFRGCLECNPSYTRPSANSSWKKFAMPKTPASWVRWVFTPVAWWYMSSDVALWGPTPTPRHLDVCKMEDVFKTQGDSAIENWDPTEGVNGYRRWVVCMCRDVCMCASTQLDSLCAITACTQRIDIPAQKRVRPRYIKVKRGVFFPVYKQGQR
ncbi:uncharacterized protein CC84DRAFT_1206782 [Paraphaeosphaeria sporulosa]|uniref:Uncharacterized protein n=1 Tax=Paraphaeosphaeria sporulosa TaxID=1460663 RepID=A0A177C9F0_9PLEO|nr:uncharacterized protein CC84DRAFT_1206782 [Paraphaeosphaeria sporulosa]OAG03398.1 hypothetical protein CC84DRAFT_1206782 [Paraphaeosphaeria sporulosa]